MVRAMGPGVAPPTPIWRTPLAVLLGAWMASVIGVTAAAGRLLEIVPADALMWAVIGLYLIPIGPLLGWGVWAMLREPLTGWLAPTILLGFCGAFVPLAQPLFDAGVDLNFQARRPIYQAVIADARMTPPRPGGRVMGERDGVRFRYATERPDEIDFIWVDGPAPVFVRYDPTPCVTTATRRCVARGRRLTPAYSFHQDLF